MAEIWPPTAFSVTSETPEMAEMVRAASDVEAPGTSPTVMSRFAGRPFGGTTKPLAEHCVGSDLFAARSPLICGYSTKIAQVIDIVKDRCRVKPDTPDRFDLLVEAQPKVAEAVKNFEQGSEDRIAGERIDVVLRAGTEILNVEEQVA